jgi:hypothetical protein
MMVKSLAYGVVRVRGWTTMKFGFAADPTEVIVPFESLAWM